MKNKLADLSEVELTAMIETARKELAERQETRRKDVIAKIKELAASIGVNVDITEPENAPTRKRGKVPVKYRNPNNAAEKWSGRGMKPKWLRELLEQGHRIEEFEVQP